MADYSAQDVNSLLPGEPWTTAKAIATFENPEAIAEGSALAPRVLSPALQLAYQRNETISTNAGGNVLVSIDLGVSRRFLITGFANITLNTTAEDGDSVVALQRSEDNSAWTDSQTIVAASNATATVNESFLVPVPVSQTARYFRLIASGDSDHLLTGNAFIICIGEAS